MDAYACGWVCKSAEREGLAAHGARDYSKDTWHVIVQLPTGPVKLTTLDAWYELLQRGRVVPA